MENNQVILGPVILYGDSWTMGQWNPEQFWKREHEFKKSRTFEHKRTLNIRILADIWTFRNMRTSNISLSKKQRTLPNMNVRLLVSPELNYQSS